MRWMSCPSRQRPRTYWRTAQVAPPWCGSAAIMPLTMMESLSIDLRVDADLTQKTSEDFVGIEELAGDRPRRAAMTVIIREDSLGPGGGLVERAERDEP